MLRKIAKTVAVVALTGGTVFAAGTGTASAAHCVAPAAEAPQPGFSYFGTDHVQESNHAEGGNPGPHGGTSGASNCRETTGSPSTRAPGRNR